MELPNRSSLESWYRTKLGDLNASQRAKLLAYLGSPPNWDNVPDSFWQEVEDETTRQQALALYLLFLSSATFHAGLTDENVEPGSFSGSAETYADRRAAELGRMRAETTRRQFEELRDRLRNRGVGLPGGDGGIPAETFTQAELDAELGKIFGETSAATTAGNEMTAAQTAGGDAGIGRTVGVSAADTWEIHPELSRGGVCPNCAALAGVPRSQWATTILPGEGHDGDPSDGPPLGIGCNCEVYYANLTA